MIPFVNTWCDLIYDWESVHVPDHLRAYVSWDM